MSMSDPIADLLTRIRNGAHVRRVAVDIPYSTIKHRICDVLVDEGYLNSVVSEGEGVEKKLVAQISYTQGGEPVLVGLRRVSKPGLRVYRGSKDAPRVRGGLGVSILSTPQGLLPDREARRRNVGGEVLCEVW